MTLLRSLPYPKYLLPSIRSSADFLQPPALDTPVPAGVRLGRSQIQPTSRGNHPKKNRLISSGGSTWTGAKSLNRSLEDRNRRVWKASGKRTVFRHRVRAERGKTGGIYGNSMQSCRRIFLDLIVSNGSIITDYGSKGERPGGEAERSRNLEGRQSHLGSTAISARVSSFKISKVQPLDGRMRVPQPE